MTCLKLDKLSILYNNVKFFFVRTVYLA